MIKVLQVCSDTNIGGAGKCILTYLKHCDRNRFDVAVVLPSNSLLAPLVKELDIPVFEIKSMADKSLDFSAIKELIGVFKEFKPDVVHTHASMSARIAARIYGAKIVYTRHSVFPPSPKLTKGIGKILCGLANNSTADRIIAVAEAAKDNITAIGVSQKKIDVVLNGVEPLKPYDSEKLSALNPLSVLARGYSVLEGERGVIKGVRDVAVGDKISVILSDGKLSAEVKEKMI